MSKFVVNKTHEIHVNGKYCHSACAEFNSSYCGLYKERLYKVPFTDNYKRCEACLYDEAELTTRVVVNKNPQRFNVQADSGLFVFETNSTIQDSLGMTLPDYIDHCNSLKYMTTSDLLEYVNNSGFMLVGGSRYRLHKTIQDSRDLVSYTGTYFRIEGDYLIVLPKPDSPIKYNKKVNWNQPIKKLPTSTTQIARVSLVKRYKVGDMLTAREVRDLMVAVSNIPNGPWNLAKIFWGEDKPKPVAKKKLKNTNIDEEDVGDEFEIEVTADEFEIEVNVGKSSWVFSTDMISEDSLYLHLDSIVTFKQFENFALQFGAVKVT